MTKSATIASLNEKVSKISHLVVNQVGSLRAQISQHLGTSHEGNRDLYTLYGYDKELSGDTGFRRMYAYARREGISNRITFGMARKCWRDGFELYDSEDDDAKRILKDELLELSRSKAVSYIERADVLNRIGRFSVLYVGVPDGREPSEPIGKVSGGKDLLSKIYYVPYAYDGVQVNTLVGDLTNPRYGLPETYSLQRMNRGDNEKDTEIKSIVAHWSRIIHLNENALDSDIEGVGALEPVFNRILDLDKVCGGSAEAYFRNSRRVTGYEVDKEFGADLLNDPAMSQKFKEGIEKFTNGWQDHTVAVGSKLKDMSVSHASPLDTVKSILWIISGYTEIPMRLLTGEGSGQLAGSEDQLAMNQIINDRRKSFCSPLIYRLFEILQMAGMISMPATYYVRFPQQEAATEDQKATTNAKKATAIKSIMDAKGGIGGDGLDVKSALSECGLSEVEYDDSEVDLEELEDEVDAIDKEAKLDDIEESN